MIMMPVRLTLASAACTTTSAPCMAWASITGSVAVPVM